MDKVRQSDNKTNLENAFSVAERELGVTRLLDPEGITLPASDFLLYSVVCNSLMLTNTTYLSPDVDVEKPDERSLITYVSSLYDVFPKVPPLPISVTVEVGMHVLKQFKLI